MLEKFVAMLRKRIRKARNDAILQNGMSHGIPLERRESLVARAKAMDWVEQEIANILKLRESDVDDEGNPTEDEYAEDEPEQSEQPEQPPPRRKPQARGWGA
jgi:hypothetical protein